MPEVADNLTFLDHDGYNISVYAYFELPEDEDVYAISSDDRLVKIVDAIKMRVGSGYGCGGSRVSAQWMIEEVRTLPKGSFDFMKSLPDAIENEKEFRIKSKKGWKRWYNNLQDIGLWLVDVSDDDNSYMEEALSVGVEKYINIY